jgi:hypothetical protein
MGASVNLVTKSGTNTLRGQIYEWFRGADLDAPNYFDKKAGRPKRDYNDNRFGAAVGGPIAKSRTFYFANFEANPFQVPTVGHRQRPDRKDAHRRLLGAARAGIAVPALRSRHHSTAPDAGRQVHSRSVSGQHHSGRSHQPRGQTDPRLLSPSEPAGTADGANNYTNPDGRGLRDLLHGDGARRSQPQRSPPHLRPLQLGLLGREKDDRFDNESTGIFLNRKNRVFAIDDAYTIKNNLLMNVRGGFTRQLFPERRRSQGFDLSSLGFANSLVSLVPGISRPSRT